MLYLSVIEALENQLQKDQRLRNLRYYRFSIPTSSVKSPFICIPWVQTTEYVSHAHPCIQDVITNSCVGNYYDNHVITLSILVGAARHKTHDADEVLDLLQNLVVEQLKLDRYLDGAVRFAEPESMEVDSFFEITPNHKGALLTVNVKYIDTPDIPDYNWIEELLGPEVDEG